MGWACIFLNSALERLNIDYYMHLGETVRNKKPPTSSRFCCSMRARLASRGVSFFLGFSGGGSPRALSCGLSIPSFVIAAVVLSPSKVCLFAGALVLSDSTPPFSPKTAPAAVLAPFPSSSLGVVLTCDVPDAAVALSSALILLLSSSSFSRCSLSRRLLSRLRLLASRSACCWPSSTAAGSAGVVVAGRREPVEVRGASVLATRGAVVAAAAAAAVGEGPISSAPAVRLSLRRFAAFSARSSFSECISRVSAAVWRCRSSSRPESRAWHATLSPHKKIRSCKENGKKIDDWVPTSKVSPTQPTPSRLRRVFFSTHTLLAGDGALWTDRGGATRLRQDHLLSRNVPIFEGDWQGRGGDQPGPSQPWGGIALHRCSGHPRAGLSGGMYIRAPTKVANDAQRIFL